MNTMQRGSATQAIQTRYKGYHFRSRLEARWAVFLDSLGVQWEYEVEGFDLSQYAEMFNNPGRDPIGMYLPDFLLKGSNAWLEVKPELPEDHFFQTRDEELMISLCSHTPVDRGVVVYGLPEIHGHCSLVVQHEKYMATVQRSPQFLGVPVLSTVDQWIEAQDAAKSARFEHGQKGRT